MTLLFYLVLYFRLLKKLLDSLGAMAGEEIKNQLMTGLNINKRLPQKRQPH